MSGDQTRLNELRKQVLGWNKVHPVGTKVRTPLYPGRVLETSSAATVLFGRKPVVHLAGFSGYFDLETVTPVETAGHEEQRTVIMFPGQGTQRRGMGAELFTSFPDETRRASEILGYSIEQLCVDDPQGRLDQTRYAQVALYVVNALGYMQHQRQSGQPRCKADILMGHSLGEYNALLAAGVFDFESGLRLVMQRAELTAAAPLGAMAVVLGIDALRVREILRRNALTGVDLANYNTPTQSSISGTPELIDRAMAALGAEGITVLRLRVSGAFHSRYMSQARESFAAYVRTVPFSRPVRPVIANATARPYDPERIAETLIMQLTSPVLWMDSVQYVLQDGPAEFIEIGGSILGPMVREITALHGTPIRAIEAHAAPVRSDSPLHRSLTASSKATAISDTERHP